MTTRTATLVALGALLVAPGAPAQEQPARWEREAFVGYTEYDYSGTGTTWDMGGRVGYRVVGPLQLDGTVTWFGYTNQSDQRQNYVETEAGFRLDVPRWKVSPFAGGGGGYAFAFSGPSTSEWTLFGSAGVRAWLSARWGLRVEGRVRSMDPWTHSRGTVSIGVMRR